MVCDAVKPWPFGPIIGRGWLAYDKVLIVKGSLRGYNLIVITLKKASFLAAFSLVCAFLLSILFINGNVDPAFPLGGTGFSLADNGIDVTKEATVNGKSVTVNTTFHDASFDESGIFVEANHYVAWSNDLDSPIRGISSLSLYTDAGSYSIYNDNVKVVCYSSYHHLDFTDIQFGGYADLMTLGMFSFYPVPLGGGAVRYVVDNANARYFLLVILTKMDIHISDVKVYTPCGEEPSVIEEAGEYGAYTSYEQNNLPSGFPFVGNGSYETTISPGSEVNFYVSGLKGNIEDFRYRLVQFGYVFVDVAEGVRDTYTYQKLNPAATCDDDRYFTLMRTEGDVYDDFVYNERITYYATPTYWAGTSRTTNWPSESIAAYLEEPSYRFVASEPYIGLDGVRYINDPANIAAAEWYGLDKEKLSTVLKAVRDYRDRLVELGFILVRDTFSPKSPGEPYGLANIRLYSPDLRFSVFMIHQCDGEGKKCYATFEFHRETTMDLPAFNATLTNNGIPAMPQGEMVFLNEDDFYYAAPVKYSDLTAYRDALLEAEVDIGWVNKNELVSNKITFTRQGKSLIYKVRFVTS